MSDTNDISVKAEAVLRFQERCKVYSQIRACIDLNDVVGLTAILQAYEYLFMVDPPSYLVDKALAQPAANGMKTFNISYFQPILTADLTKSTQECLVHINDNPLHYAVYKGSVDCVRVLLSTGLSPIEFQMESSESHLFTTPLTIAICHQNYEMVQLLTDFGACCTQQSSKIAPYELLLQYSTPLLQAISLCDIKLLDILLLHTQNHADEFENPSSSTHSPKQQLKSLNEDVEENTNHVDNKKTAVFEFTIDEKTGEKIHKIDITNAEHLKQLYLLTFMKTSKKLTLREKRLKIIQTPMIHTPIYVAYQSGGLKWVQVLVDHFKFELSTCNIQGIHCILELSYNWLDSKIFRILSTNHYFNFEAILLLQQKHFLFTYLFQKHAEIVSASAGPKDSSLLIDKKDNKKDDKKGSFKKIAPNAKDGDSPGTEKMDILTKLFDPNTFTKGPLSLNERNDAKLQILHHGKKRINTFHNSYKILPITLLIFNLLPLIQQQSQFSSLDDINVVNNDYVNPTSAVDLCANQTSNTSTVIPVGQDSSNASSTQNVSQTSNTVTPTASVNDLLQQQQPSTVLPPQPIFPITEESRIWMIPTELAQTSGKLIISSLLPQNAMAFAIITQRYDILLTLILNNINNVKTLKNALITPTSLTLIACTGWLRGLKLIFSLVDREVVIFALRGIYTTMVNNIIPAPNNTSANSPPLLIKNIQRQTHILDLALSTTSTSTWSSLYEICQKYKFTVSDVYTLDSDYESPISRRLYQLFPQQCYINHNITHDICYNHNLSILQKQHNTIPANESSTLQLTTIPYSSSTIGQNNISNNPLSPEAPLIPLSPTNELSNQTADYTGFSNASNINLVSLGNEHGYYRPLLPPWTNSPEANKRIQNGTLVDVIHKYLEVELERYNHDIQKHVPANTSSNVTNTKPKSSKDDYHHSLDGRLSTNLYATTQINTDHRQSLGGIEEDDALALNNRSGSPGTVKSPLTRQGSTVMINDTGKKRGLLDSFQPGHNATSSLQYTDKKYQNPYLDQHFTLDILYYAMIQGDWNTLLLLFRDFIIPTRNQQLFVIHSSIFDAINHLKPLHFNIKEIVDLNNLSLLFCILFSDQLTPDNVFGKRNISALNNGKPTSLETLASLNAIPQWVYAVFQTDLLYYLLCNKPNNDFCNEYIIYANSIDDNVKKVKNAITHDINTGVPLVCNIKLSKAKFNPNTQLYQPIDDTPNGKNDESNKCYNQEEIHRLNIKLTVTLEAKLYPHQAVTTRNQKLTFIGDFNNKLHCYEILYAKAPHQYYCALSPFHLQYIIADISHANYNLSTATSQQLFWDVWFQTNSKYHNYKQISLISTKLSQLDFKYNYVFNSTYINSIEYRLLLNYLLFYRISLIILYCIETLNYKLLIYCFYVLNNYIFNRDNTSQKMPSLSELNDPTNNHIPQQFMNKYIGIINFTTHTPYIYNVLTTIIPMIWNPFTNQFTTNGCNYMNLIHIMQGIVKPLFLSLDYVSENGVNTDKTALLMETNQLSTHSFLPSIPSQANKMKDYVMHTKYGYIRRVRHLFLGGCNGKQYNLLTKNKYHKNNKCARQNTQISTNNTINHENGNSYDNYNTYITRQGSVRKDDFSFPFTTGGIDGHVITKADFSITLPRNVDGSSHENMIKLTQVDTEYVVMDPQYQPKGYIKYFAQLLQYYHEFSQLPYTSAVKLSRHRSHLSIDTSCSPGVVDTTIPTMVSPGPTNSSPLHHDHIDDDHLSASSATDDDEDFAIGNVGNLTLEEQQELKKKQKIAAHIIQKNTVIGSDDAFEVGFGDDDAVDFGGPLPPPQPTPSTEPSRPTRPSKRPINAARSSSNLSEVAPSESNLSTDSAHSDENIEKTAENPTEEKKEEPIAEKAEETKKEEPIAEKAEETKKEEPIAEKAEETKKEEPIAEKAEETKKEEPEDMAGEQSVEKASDIPEAVSTTSDPALISTPSSAELIRTVSQASSVSRPQRPQRPTSVVRSMTHEDSFQQSTSAVEPLPNLANNQTGASALSNTTSMDDTATPVATPLSMRKQLSVDTTAPVNTTAPSMLSPVVNVVGNDQQLHTPAHVNNASSGMNTFKGDSTADTDPLKQNTNNVVLKINLKPFATGDDLSKLMFKSISIVDVDDDGYDTDINALTTINHPVNVEKSALAVKGNKNNKLLLEQVSSPATSYITIGALFPFVSSITSTAVAPQFDPAKYSYSKSSKLLNNQQIKIPSSVFLHHPISNATEIYNNGFNNYLSSIYTTQLTYRRAITLLSLTRNNVLTSTDTPLYKHFLPSLSSHASATSMLESQKNEVMKSYYVLLSRYYDFMIVTGDQLRREYKDTAKASVDPVTKQPKTKQQKKYEENIIENMMKVKDDLDLAYKALEKRCKADFDGQTLKELRLSQQYSSSLSTAARDKQQKALDLHQRKNTSIFRRMSSVVSSGINTKKETKNIQQIDVASSSQGFIGLTRRGSQANLFTEETRVSTVENRGPPGLFKQQSTGQDYSEWTLVEHERTSPDQAPSSVNSATSTAGVVFSDPVSDSFPDKQLFVSLTISLQVLFEQYELIYLELLQKNLKKYDSPKAKQTLLQSILPPHFVHVILTLLLQIPDITYSVNIYTNLIKHAVWCLIFDDLSELKILTLQDVLPVGVIGGTNGYGDNLSTYINKYYKFNDFSQTNQKIDGDVKKAKMATIMTLLSSFDDITTITRQQIYDLLNNCVKAAKKADTSPKNCENDGNKNEQEIEEVILTPNESVNLLTTIVLYQFKLYIKQRNEIIAVDQNSCASITPSTIKPALSRRGSTLYIEQQAANTMVDLTTLCATHLSVKNALPLQFSTDNGLFFANPVNNTPLTALPLHCIHFHAVNPAFIYILIQHNLNFHFTNDMGTSFLTNCIQYYQVLANTITTQISTAKLMAGDNSFDIEHLRQIDNTTVNIKKVQESVYQLITSLILDHNVSLFTTNFALHTNTSTPTPLHYLFLYKLYDIINYIMMMNPVKLIPPHLFKIEETCDLGGNLITNINQEEKVFYPYDSMINTVLITPYDGSIQQHDIPITTPNHSIKYTELDYPFETQDVKQWLSLTQIKYPTITSIMNDIQAWGCAILYNKTNEVQFTTPLDSNLNRSEELVSVDILHTTTSIAPKRTIKSINEAMLKNTQTDKIFSQWFNTHSDEQRFETVHQHNYSSDSNIMVVENSFPLRILPVSFNWIEFVSIYLPHAVQYDVSSAKHATDINSFTQSNAYRGEITKPSYQNLLSVEYDFNYYFNAREHFTAFFSQQHVIKTTPIASNW